MFETGKRNDTLRPGAGVIFLRKSGDLQSLWGRTGPYPGNIHEDIYALYFGNK